MKFVSLAGLAVFMLTSLVVGTCVLNLAWRTRKLPELLLGSAVLCIGFLTFALGSAGKLLFEGTEALRGSLTIAALAIECTGSSALIAFAWRVFHPKSKLAAAFALSLVGLIAAALCFELLSGQYLRYSDSLPISGPSVLLGLAARGAGPAFMAFECFRYYSKLRRRMRLGLADPLVVHRVALWGVGIGGSAVGYAISVLHRLAYGTGLREHALVLNTVSLIATVSALSIGIAFFPPRAYRRWAERSSSALVG